MVMEKTRNPFFSSLVLLLSFALMAVQASAIDVHSSQENIVITMERGSEFEFPLIVLGSDKTMTLDTAGNVGDWVTFGGDGSDEWTVYPVSDQNVLVTIVVPSDSELGEYTADIRADGSRISKIIVKVTVKLADARSYEELEDIDEEVGSLRERIETLTDSLIDTRTQMTTLENEVSEKMEEISDYQKDLTDLESENTELKEDLETLQQKSQELEDSNTELNALTGMLIGTQVPGMFIGGLVLGIVIVTLIVKRMHVYKRVKGAGKRVTQREKQQESFRYKYKPS
jgi:prefoldin subunit 5